MGSNEKKKDIEVDAGSSAIHIMPTYQLANVVNQRCRYRTLPGQIEFVTLKLTHDGIKNTRQNLPLQFLRNNHITEPGLITMLGKYGSKTMVLLNRDSQGRMNLGKGWREFVSANGLKIGEVFTLEAVWEDTNLMLKLSSMETKKEKKKIREGSTSSLEINHQVVTLKLTREVLRTSTLILPVPFMQANGIKGLGKIGFEGQDHTQWWGYLSTTHGHVVVGLGWGNFCKLNGVKEDDSFTLEFLHEDQFPILKFCPNIQD